MKLGKVIGRVTLSVATPGLEGARWLLVSPFSRGNYLDSMAGEKQLSAEPTPVVYDNLGGGVHDIIGYIEGREAASPFVTPPPIDAINAALIDKFFYTPSESE